MLVWIKRRLRSELGLVLLLLLDILVVLLLLRVERISHVVHLILLHLRSHLVLHGQLRLLLVVLVAAAELLPILLWLALHKLGLLRPRLPLHLLTIRLLLLRLVLLIVGHELALVVIVLMPRALLHRLLLLLLLLLHNGSCSLCATRNEWLRF